MFIVASFIIAKTWKQPKCPQTGEWMKKVWGVCIYTCVCVCVCVYNEILVSQRKE